MATRKKRLKPPPAKKPKRVARALPSTPARPVKPTKPTKPTKRAKKKHARKLVTDAVINIAELRFMAKADYVTDPERRSFRVLYDDDRKPYKKNISYSAFEKWALADNWAERRDQYWKEVTEIAISGIQQQVAVQRLKELAQLSEASDYYFEYMLPLRDADGEIERYPDDHEKYPGLPKFPLDMPRLDQFMRAWLDVDERRMLKRGEATTRSDNLNEADDGAPKLSSIDPVAQKVSINRADVRVLAQALLERRQPELVSPPEVEDGDEEDE